VHYTLRKASDLLVGQHPAGIFCEGRHEFAGNTVRDDLTQAVITSDCEIDGIGEWEHRAVPAVFTVAGGAVFFIERGEGKHFVGAQNLGSRSGAAGNVIASEGGKANRDEKECAAPRGFERSQSHFTSSFVSI
jgi:hypothetical protein